MLSIKVTTLWKIMSSIGIFEDAHVSQTSRSQLPRFYARSTPRLQDQYIGDFEKLLKMCEREVSWSTDRQDRAPSAVALDRLFLGAVYAVSLHLDVLCQVRGYCDRVPYTCCFI